MNDKAELKHHL